jgi:hypothetical protein
LSTSTGEVSVFVNLSLDDLRVAVDGLYFLLEQELPIEDRRRARALVHALQAEHGELAKVNGKVN